MREVARLAAVAEQLGASPFAIASANCATVFAYSPLCFSLPPKSLVDGKNRRPAIAIVVIIAVVLSVALAGELRGLVGGARLDIHVHGEGSVRFP